MNDLFGGFTWRFPGLDLVAFQAHLNNFVLGGSAWVGFPVFKLRYSSDRWYRCAQFHLGLFCFFIELNVPLWFEYVAGEPHD